MAIHRIPLRQDPPVFIEMADEYICGHFYLETEPGNWCVPAFDNTFLYNGRVIEVGLYREPDDGSYTLQVFSGDDVIFCEAVETVFL